jgi:hypothetical protein
VEGMMVSRREFLEKSGKAVGFASAAAIGLESILSGCAIYDPYTTPSEGFDLKKFKRWFKREKL